MKLVLWLLTLWGYTITVHGHLQTIVANPGGIGGIYKGPDSETIVQGPDGSIITSQEKGGLIATEQKFEPIVVAESAVLDLEQPISPGLIEDSYIAHQGQSLPIVEDQYIQPLVNPEPVITAGPTAVVPLEPQFQPLVPVAPVGHNVNIIEPDPHIIETEIIDAPEIEPLESTDLVGPSGSISTRGSESIVSGPASTTITKKAKILVAPPVISGIPVVSPALAPIHPLPLVEINNEIPLASAAPVIAQGPVLSSTISPIPISTAYSPVLSSTLAPQIGSTIAPPTVHQGAYLRPAQTLAPSVLKQELHQINHVISSTIAPPTVHQEAYLRPAQPVQFVSTEAPHLGSSTPSPPFATGLLSGEQFEDIRPAGRSVLGHSIPVASTTIRPIPVHSSGVSVEDEGATGFIQPGVPYGLVHPSTISPISSTVAPSYNQEYLNRQFLINPSNIPIRNIVPPEIRLPQGAIDLGTTVSSVTREHNRVPEAPGLFDSYNTQTINHIDNNINPQGIEHQQIPVEQNIQNGYYHNEVLLGNVYPQHELGSSNVALLRDTNPVQNNYAYQNREIQDGIPHPGPYTGSDVYLPQDSEQAVHTGVWNRYGRKRRNRKY